MDVATAMQFVRQHHRGVVIALKSDGRPHASNIVYAADDGTVRISVTADRAKTRHLQADARASMHVTTADFGQWAVVDGTAVLSPVATHDDRATLDGLRALYRDVNGEHPNWDDYDNAMVADRRMLLTIEVDNAYGQLAP